MSVWPGVTPAQQLLIEQTDARELREMEQRRAELAAAAEDKAQMAAHSAAMFEKINGHSMAEIEQARAESREVREAMRAFAHLPYGSSDRPAIFIGDREITAAPEPAGSARRAGLDPIGAELEASRVIAQSNWTPAVRAMFADAAAERYRGHPDYAHHLRHSRALYDAPPPREATPPRRRITRFTETPFVAVGDF